MILSIESLVRLPEDRVRCRVMQDTGPFEFTVRFETFEAGIRGCNFEGLSPKERYDLTNRDEWRPVMQALFAFDRGEAVALPHTVRSSSPD